MEPYKPVPFRSLGGGLNLRDSEVSETQAIDLLNVEFDERGAVSKRYGYAQFTGAELTNQPDSVFPHYESDGTTRLLVGNGNRLDALNTSGASVANTTSTASPHLFVRYGGPTVEATYIANGTDQVQKFDGTSFTTPAGLAGQSGKFLTVTPTSNRLVVAREQGASAGSNPSSVNFSDAGAPETFGSSNYVDLDPGDGEAITGMVSWANYVFVFKPSKFWVFYSETTDSTGAPVFNFRKIDTGIGVAAPRAVAAGRDAVYFMGSRGVYRTRGQEPELVSDIIEPFFLGNPSIYFKSNPLSHTGITAAAMAWHDERIYLAVPTGSSATNDRMLVFDTRYNWWSLYDIAAAALTPFRVGAQAELVFAAPTGSNYVYRHSSAYLNDGMTTTATGGTPVSGRWRSGWFSYGPEVRTIRESVLLGTGRVDITFTKDREDVAGTPETLVFSGDPDTWGDGTSMDDLWGDGTDSTDLWGPANTLSSKGIRHAIRGRSFSVKLANSASESTFAVHNFINHLREGRVPSVVETE